MRTDKKTIILVDTREQTPYLFGNGQSGKNAGGIPSIEIKRRKLDSGDYSIEGSESEITIERKSISDFLNSVTWERKRFEDEAKRLSKFQYAGIVVEGRLDDVLNPEQYGRRIHSHAISETVACWSIRYGVHFHFLKNRSAAEAFTLSLLLQYLRLSQQKAEADTTPTVTTEAEEGAEWR